LAQRAGERRGGVGDDAERRGDLRQQRREARHGGTQLVGDAGGRRGDRDGGPHGGECERLEEDDPARGIDVRCERVARRGGETLGEVGGEAEAGLRRLARELQGAGHASDGRRGPDVLVPVLQLGLLARREGRTHLGGERARRLVAHDHRVVARGDHGAQVAQIDALLNGEIDFMDVGNDINAVTRARGSDKVRVQIAKAPLHEHLTFGPVTAVTSDVRVRQALNFAFDFEWANQNLFYGQYVRSRSYFNNSEMEAKGLPSPAELAILEPLRDKLPPEVFTTEFSNPVSDTPQAPRRNLREAARLLNEAGWAVAQDGGRSVLKNEKGERLSIEFLLDSPLFERIAIPYQQQLEKLGIGVSIKTVDSAQYERRTQTFDFDIVVGNWGQSLSPGNEQRDFWGSEAASRNGSRNLVGIANPAIDSLIETLVFAPDRESLVTACKALDRALLWNHYVVPMWYIDYERTARWDRFGSPDKLPDLSTGFPSVWWWDAEKAKKVAGQ